MFRYFNMAQTTEMEKITPSRVKLFIGSMTYQNQIMSTLVYCHSWAYGSSNALGNNQEGLFSRREVRYPRHSTSQIQHLEAYFTECPNPDDNQRNQLSVKLGLYSDQIKIWFQKKRSQTRSEHGRADSAALRSDNDRLSCENLTIQEALKIAACSSCGREICSKEKSEEQRQSNLDCLKLEHAFLKEQIRSLTIKAGIAPEPSTIGISDQEKSVMAETAVGAMHELVELLKINESLWIKFPTKGNYSLHRETYENIFPKESHFRNSTSLYESSKDECLASLKGRQLVEIFLDPTKWIDLFPTIVMKANTVLVLDTGVLRNDGSSLQLLDIQLHTLSPLVAARSFCLLRYSQQIEPGKWVIADVSYEGSREALRAIPSLCWKLPSGCMISFTKVTWVEHVEVPDDATQTHQLYKDLVSSGAAYGVERWIVTLKRMCERFTYSGKQTTSSVDEFGRACTFLEGKRGMKNLAHRMVKTFCARLSMPGKTDFSLPMGSSNSGMQVSVRENTESGQPNGMIIMATASLWLPLSVQDVFNFFTDQRTRFQWETLYNDTPMYETTRIANGIHPGNSITILESHVRKENQVLQETSIDELGGLVVYAPIHVSAIDLALSGTSTSTIPILPSGIIFSSDGRSDSSYHCASSDPNRSSSLVTVAFQMLVGDNWSSDQAGQDSVSEITTKIISTIQRIKVALGCCHLD